MAAKLEQFSRDPLTETAQVAISVYDLTAGQPIYAFNARQRMRPASNMKVLTAIAALDQLGTDYRVQTTLYAGSSISAEGTLAGNVALKAGFDPCLDEADLRALFVELRNKGVRTIKGDFILDLSIKDTARWGWGWCWDDDAHTNPTLTPLSIENRAINPAIRSALTAAGISLKGQIRRGRIAQGMQRIAVAHHTIDAVLGPMMKRSNNFFAESLFYQLGAQSRKPYANHKDAAAYVEKFVRKIGLNPDAYTIADGSGVSLYNYVSAELFVAALRYAYAHPDLYAHLKASLPIAGVDGTLKNRMQGTSAQRHIFAKTGTVTGISSLSGYAEASNGHVLAFSILCQGVQSASTARAYQDRICRALTQ